jgi:hypothetical protein
MYHHNAKLWFLELGVQTGKGLGAIFRWRISIVTLGAAAEIKLKQPISSDPQRNLLAFYI